MPHLQFELNRELDGETRTRLTEWATEQYSETMATGTGHIAVTIRELEPSALSMGRAPDDEAVAVLNADVRAGRSLEQRRSYARGAIDTLAALCGVPSEHCYVVYTEHPGEDFVLDEGPLESWSTDEADEGAIDD